MAEGFGSIARSIAAEVRDRADAEVLFRLYQAISVDPESVRASLRAAGRPFIDPSGVGPFDEGEIRLTAEHLITQAGLSAGLFGATAGMGGAFSLPTQVVAELASGVRLAQALAVVYGFEPGTDRGTVAVTRALAAGFEVDLPEQGVIELRVSQLTSIARPRAPVALETAVGELAKSMMRRTLWRVAGRASRWVPVFGVGLAMRGARARVHGIGERMRATLHRLAEFQVSGAVDAIEVG